MNVRNEFSLLKSKVLKYMDKLKYFTYTPRSYMSRGKNLVRPATFTIRNTSTQT